MIQILTSSKIARTPLRRLGTDSSFLLKLHGYNVLVLKLPAQAVREISGQDLVAVGGTLASFKAKLKFTPQAERWLAVTSVDNPMLEQLDDFQASVAQELGHVTGEIIVNSSVEVCATVPLGEREPFDPTTEYRSV